MLSSSQFDGVHPHFVAHLHGRQWPRPRWHHCELVSGGLLCTTDARAATSEAVFDLIAGMAPLRRVTTPAEFADAVLFFLSSRARAVTGKT